MDLATLTVFRTVARELSVTGAARQLGRAPSNVTTRIQQLEEELGVALFRRDRRRLGLTGEGELFLGYAERILNLSDEARQVLNPAVAAGALRLGAMESTVASRLPLPLARFHRDWPAVRLEVSTAPSRHLVDAVANHRLDCALAALPPGEEAGEAVGDDIETMPVFREALVLLLPPGHGPVDGPADVGPRTLAAFAPGCTYRAIAEDWLAGAEGPGGLRIQDVRSYHAMFACVAAGSCVSVMPRTVIDLMPAPPPLVQRPLMSIDTALVWRRGYATAAFAAWRDTLAGVADATPPG